MTYKFYVGRLAVFDESYAEAQEALEYALQHCHKGAARNKALVLKYLVPVRGVGRAALRRPPAAPPTAAWPPARPAPPPRRSSCYWAACRRLR